MAQITYDDKSAINVNSSVPNVNKVNASDMNEIKSVVNANWNALADYVKEIGSTTVSGVTWNWVKWNSGKIELTTSVSNTGLNMTSSSAGTYYGTGTSAKKTLTLPFTLTSVYYIGSEETAPRSSGIYIYSATISGATMTTEFRAHASASNVSCGANYYVIGAI